MSGVFEDDDPGRGTFHRETIVVSSGGDAPRPFDVDLTVDRLRFMGLDRALVDEAEERLRADAGAGMQWLRQQLARLEPPRTAPACDCGEPLVPLEWRGRATVRCSVCGSRWGVDVDEEGESLWNISGPDEAWRAAHAGDEVDPYDPFPPDDVLGEDLPPLPAGGVRPGSWFPLATWQGEGHAAVLYVHRRPPGEYGLPGDEYESEIEHLVLEEDGRWAPTGGGGGNWVDVFDAPTDLLEKYVVLGTGTTGTDDGTEPVSFTGGLCSPAVAAVETVDRRGTLTYPVARERPFFLVGVHGPGEVRILDDHGATLRTRRGQPLAFRMND